MEILLASIGSLLLGLILGFCVARHNYAKTVKKHKNVVLENTYLKERLEEQRATIHWIENVDSERTELKRRISDKIISEVRK